MKQRKTYVILAIATAFAVSLVSCTSSTNTATNAADPAPQAGVAVSEQAVAPLVYSEWGLAGDAAEVTDPFPMPAGSTTFDFTHSGQDIFSLTLLDGAGKAVKEVAAGTGATMVSGSVTLEAAGTFQLQIQAAGEWELNVRYPE